MVVSTRGQRANQAEASPLQKLDEPERKIRARSQAPRPKAHRKGAAQADEPTLEAEDVEEDVPDEDEEENAMEAEPAKEKKKTIIRRRRKRITQPTVEERSPSPESHFISGAKSASVIVPSAVAITPSLSPPPVASTKSSAKTRTPNSEIDSFFSAYIYEAAEKGATKLFVCAMHPENCSLDVPSIDPVEIDMTDACHLAELCTDQPGSKRKRKEGSKDVSTKKHKPLEIHLQGGYYYEDGKFMMAVSEEDALRARHMDDVPPKIGPRATKAIKDPFEARDLEESKAHLRHGDGDFEKNGKPSGSGSELSSGVLSIGADARQVEKDSDEQVEVEISDPAAKQRQVLAAPETPRGSWRQSVTGFLTTPLRLFRSSRPPIPSFTAPHVRAPLQEASNGHVNASNVQHSERFLPNVHSEPRKSQPASIAPVSTSRKKSEQNQVRRAARDNQEEENRRQEALMRIQEQYIEEEVQRRLASELAKALTERNSNTMEDEAPTKRKRGEDAPGHVPTRNTSLGLDDTFWNNADNDSDDDLGSRTPENPDPPAKRVRFNNETQPLETPPQSGTGGPKIPKTGTPYKLGSMFRDPPLKSALKQTRLVPTGGLRERNFRQSHIDISGVSEAQFNISGHFELSDSSDDEASPTSTAMDAGSTPHPAKVSAPAKPRFSEPLEEPRTPMATSFGDVLSRTSKDAPPAAPQPSHATLPATFPVAPATPAPLSATTPRPPTTPAPSVLNPTQPTGSARSLLKHQPKQSSGLRNMTGASDETGSARESQQDEAPLSLDGMKEIDPEVASAIDSLGPEIFSKAAENLINSDPDSLFIGPDVDFEIDHEVLTALRKLEDDVYQNSVGALNQSDDSFKLDPMVTTELERKWEGLWTQNGVDTLFQHGVARSIRL